MGTEVVYVSNNAPSLRVGGIVGGALQFAKGVLRLDSEKDEAAIAEFDKLLATKPHLSQLVRKTDKEAAAKRLVEANAKLVAERGTHVGGVTGDAASAAAQLVLRDQELLKHAAETGKPLEEVVKAAETATNGAITVGNMATKLALGLGKK